MEYTNQNLYDKDKEMYDYLRSMYESAGGDARAQNAVVDQYFQYFNPQELRKREQQMNLRRMLSGEQVDDPEARMMAQMYGIDVPQQNQPTSTFGQLANQYRQSGGGQVGDLEIETVDDTTSAGARLGQITKPIQDASPAEWFKVASEQARAMPYYQTMGGDTLGNKLMDGVSNTATGFLSEMPDWLNVGGIKDLGKGIRNRQEEQIMRKMFGEQFPDQPMPRSFDNYQDTNFNTYENLKGTPFEGMAWDAFNQNNNYLQQGLYGQKINRTGGTRLY